MALIADLCPHCQQITRCHIVERLSIVGGALFGIPLVLPMSSVTCACGECGFEFQSQSWDYQKTVEPAEAVSLDIETLLSRTNPRLKEMLVLSELRAIPQLSGALQLLAQLPPGSLRTGLKDTLQQWSLLDVAPRGQFLAKVNDCSEMLQFARLMAGRYTTGALGCLGGAVGCVGVWSGCFLVLGGGLRLWGWVAVVVAGLMTGSLLSHLLWRNRDRRWVKDVLIPEAQQSGINFDALLAVLEDGGPSNLVKDDLRLLRQLAPTIRDELASSGKGGEDGFAFGAPQRPFPAHNATRE